MYRSTGSAKTTPGSAGARRVRQTQAVPRKSEVKPAASGAAAAGGATRSRPTSASLSASAKQAEALAPVELVAEFLGRIMAGDYGRAQILCRQILILEPRNKTVLEFRALLEQKLQMDKDRQNEEAAEEEEDEDAESSTSDEDEEDTHALETSYGFAAGSRSDDDNDENSDDCDDNDDDCDRDEEHHGVDHSTGADARSDAGRNSSYAPSGITLRAVAADRDRDAAELVQELGSLADMTAKMAQVAL